jgi:hypothetical protein
MMGIDDTDSRDVLGLMLRRFSIRSITTVAALVKLVQNFDRVRVTRSDDF